MYTKLHQISTDDNLHFRLLSAHALHTVGTILDKTHFHTPIQNCENSRRVDNLPNTEA